MPAEFDVEDFFASDTDFVVGLDQIDQHVGDRGGEPARVYLEGDLTDPATLTTIAAAVDQMQSLDTPSLARDDDGRVEVEGGVFSVFDAAWDSPSMLGIVAAPMPLFAAYGLLTALMIMLALVATLAVLPSLLVVITRDADAPAVDLDVDLGNERRAEAVTV